jgi:hypothetical protein
MNKTEWDFSENQIEKWELPWCFCYEYARNSNVFLKGAAQWRKRHKGAPQHFSRALQALKVFGQSGLVEDFGSLAQLLEIFLSLQRVSPEGRQQLLERPRMKPLVQVFESGFPAALKHLAKLYRAVFREKAADASLLHATCQMDLDYCMVLDASFPKQAYLEADSASRRLKLFLLNQFIQPDLTSKLDPKSKSAIQSRPFWQTTQKQAGFECLEQNSRTERQGLFLLTYSVVAVNWAYSNDQILPWVGKWLEENRPHLPYDRGRRTNERDLLKALGALRLCQAMGWRKAEEYTKGVLGTPLYSGKKSWQRAVKKAEAQLAEPPTQLGCHLAPGAK